MVMTKDIEKLCSRLSDLADLLGDNDDESNERVCRQAIDVIKMLYSKADEFYKTLKRFEEKLS